MAQRDVPETIRRSALAFSLFAALASCTPAIEPEAPDLRIEPEEIATSAEAIINGTASSARDYPSAGVLLVLARFMGQGLGSMICTGTLIAPDVVLTAAHCTQDLFGGSGITPDYYFSFDLDVSEFGQTNLNLPADAVRVGRLVAHPDFNPNSNPGPGLGNFNDVGLLFLDGEITNVVPEIVADDADGASLVQGMEVAIAGYGQTSATDQNSAGVKYHALTVLNEVGANEVQIGDRPPVPQKCHGDSGGPTYLESTDGRTPARRVIGITSRAYDDSDCARGGVDTRADVHRAWIESEMVNACNAGMRSPTVCAGWATLPTASGGGVRDAGVRDSGTMGRDASTPDLGFVDSGVALDGGVGVDASTGTDAGGASDGGIRDAGRRLSSGSRDSSGCTCVRERASGLDLGAGLFVAALGLVIARRNERR